MDENGSSKLTGIRQIVKFKEILQKWQAVTLGSKASSPRAGSPRAGSLHSDRRAGGSPHSDQRVTSPLSDQRAGSPFSDQMGSSPHSDRRAGSPHSDRNRGGISPAINKRLTNVICCDSDEDNCYSPEPPPDVPEGYLAVYVGPELRRFIIPTSYLSHSLFKVLLQKAEEEFGFDHSGGLTIPCETETFKYLLKCMENHQKAHPDDSPAGDWKLIQ